MKPEVVTIVSPVNGKAVPITEVPDPVFADKILGEGIAVIPEDGIFLCPVDGEVASVAESLHAIGFSTEEGLEVLMHIGLDTVKLNGEGFTLHVKVGDKVKKGDLIAEVNLDFIKEQGLNTITPVIICDGADDKQIAFREGNIEAGKTVIAVLSETEEVEATVVETKESVAIFNI
mgnify:CR=1 FL=1